MPITGAAALIIVWTRVYASIYGVDPAFALAVAHVESRTAHQEFRVGLIGGRYYAPYAIHKDFMRLRGWPVDTLQGNIEAGVRALRGSSHRAVLRRYNREFTEDYYRAVELAAKEYRRKLAYHE